MKTVLIGWELGAGRGHVERLVPIVTACRKQGWRVIAALRDARLGVEIIGPHQSQIAAGRLEIIQAPIFSHTTIETRPVYSLAEILANMGFADPNLVRPLTGAWEVILTRYRPDVVISDSAPGLNVVARGRIPLIVIGNGWTIPPDVETLPALVPKSDAETIGNAADTVLAVMREARRGETRINRFSDLLRGDFNMVCSVHETDPYRRLRSDPLYWPFEIAEPATIPESERSGGVIYLPNDHPARKIVEHQAGNLGMRFEAFFNGGEKCASPNVFVHERPMDFANVIPRKRLVIHHGGLGTAIWCVGNRVPQLIFPADLEKLLIAKGVVEGGFGISVPAHDPQTNFAASVNSASLKVPRFNSQRMATLSPEASIKALEGFSVMAT